MNHFCVSGVVINSIADKSMAQFYIKYTPVCILFRMYAEYEDVQCKEKTECLDNVPDNIFHGFEINAILNNANRCPVLMFLKKA